MKKGEGCEGGQKRGRHGGGEGEGCGGGGE
jgi:hypothetical protein